MTPEEILSGAIEVIERDGWFQGNIFQYPDALGPEEYVEASKKAPVCSIGAIYRAAYGRCLEINFTEAGEELCASVGVAMNKLKRTLGIDGIAHWNDDPARSKEDVILAMKQAANG